MTTTTEETRHSALVELLLRLLHNTVEALAAPTVAGDEEEDIDWESGEPEDETRAA